MTMPGTPSKSTKRTMLLVYTLFQTKRKTNKSEAESKHYVIKKLAIARIVPHGKAFIPKS